MRVIDAETNEHLEFTAKVIFLCASTFGSTFILLNSVSKRFPNGFGNDSGELGCNIMDHHLDAGATALVEGYEDRYYLGNRPNDLYIPRYRNLGGEQRDYIRGFGYQGNAIRLGWTRLLMDSTFGGAVKTQGATPGPWYIKLGGFGEILPNHANRVTLDRTRKDKWGLPLLAFDAQLHENELKMRKDMANDAAEMLEAAGFTDVRTYDRRDRRRSRHSRDGHRAHGQGPEDLGAQQVEPGARVPERVRHRRLVHGVQRVSEPFAHLHGHDCARRRSCGRRAEADES